MTAQLKVSELPKEEQDALINEAKELNIRGIGQVQMWGVETLKSKIAQAKAQLQAPPKNADADTDADKGTDINAEEKNEEENTNIEVNNNESENNKTNLTTSKTVEEPVQPKTEKTPKEKEKPFICHICRSKVENGKCTGCGFEVFK